MPDIRVSLCDGCLGPVSLDVEDVKVVTGCTGHYPPDTIFHYCPSCHVPEVKDLASDRPYYVVQSVEIFQKGDWLIRWQGRVMFDEGRGVFTDGYERVLDI